MKRIHLHDIEINYKLHEYKDLYDKVLQLLDAEKIKPVRASGKNGKRPALYNEYWVLEKKQDVSGYVEELEYLLVPAISTNYYLNHIQRYIEDREWVLLLNSFLKNDREALRTARSLNERSFEIWHREKFLKEEQGKKILKRCGISLELLNIYETTEPLAYYTYTREIPQNILIVENKDTFYSMRRYLLSGQNTIMGVRIGTLIYGAGKGIHRSFQDFDLCAEPYMRDDRNLIYYFGDIDYEGIIIYESFAVTFGENYRIKPYVTGYIEMVNKAMKLGVGNLPKMKEGQNQNIGERFWNAFPADIVSMMKQILEDGRYIPQEILSIEDFEKGI